jgi:hypothetical protein
MDKETLSNYGWIVICVMVLAVMIALATPFGTFVSNAVKSTTNGLFDVSDKALEVVGIDIENEAKLENTIPEGIEVEITHKPSGEKIDTSKLFSVTGNDIGTGHEWDESITNNTYYNANECTAIFNQNGIEASANIDYDFTIMDYGKNSITFLSLELKGFTIRQMSDYQITVAHNGGHKTMLDFMVQEITINETAVSIPTIRYGYFDSEGNNCGYSDWYALWNFDKTTKTFTIMNADTIVDENLVFYVDCGNHVFYSIFPTPNS